MKGFSFHPLAERELIEAARYYESRAQGLGRAFIDEVEAIVGQIAELPEKMKWTAAHIEKRGEHGD